MLRRCTNRLHHYQYRGIGVVMVTRKPIYIQNTPHNEGRGIQTLALVRENDTRVSCCGVPRPAYSQGLSHTSQRHIWGWLNAIFNKVDENRIKEVGPDRACAEWLLRCGALVKWRDRETWTKDYNTLPPSGNRVLKIAEVDATDSAVMHIGFPHLQGCKYIKKIIFHKANYMDDAALSQLPTLRDSLTHLQVSSCGNITLDGLKHIKKLEKLEHLLLYDLPTISNKEEVVKEIQEALPKCHVSFPYAQAEDDPSLQQPEEEEEKKK
ncbi:hypothetical protein Pmani_004445 [Petrolisthes manimaculis]|uniref:ATP synthase subunit s, mitochondrial n=1 Tax=Petrolisthes manimaculis TaxID=1843537 RepID=A0AAE1QE29_9EUCA|nr:hypothetical protein Pmani_004445 [Petrolisthes manimaculis]